MGDTELGRINEQICPDPNDSPRKNSAESFIVDKCSTKEPEAAGEPTHVFIEGAENIKLVPEYFQG